MRRTTSSGLWEKKASRFLALPAVVTLVGLSLCFLVRPPLRAQNNAARPKITGIAYVRLWVDPMEELGSRKLGAGSL